MPPVINLASTDRCRRSSTSLRLLTLLFSLEGTRIKFPTQGLSHTRTRQRQGHGQASASSAVAAGQKKILAFFVLFSAFPCDPVPSARQQNFFPSCVKSPLLSTSKRELVAMRSRRNAHSAARVACAECADKMSHQVGVNRHVRARGWPRSSVRDHRVGSVRTSGFLFL